jgi:polyhydroxybutyrate depolymerase
MKVFFSLIPAMCLTFSAISFAQGIDFGRGEIPVTVPASYSGENPSPLIILLHGYGSNGPRQDSYLGFSRVADRYGFLLVAPTGTQEVGDAILHSGMRQMPVAIFLTLRSTIMLTSPESFKE